MTVGLRVRDQYTGQIKLDTSYRMGRVLGTIATGAASGSQHSPGLTQGALFYRLGLVQAGNPSAYPSTNFISQLRQDGVYASGEFIYWNIAWWRNGLPSGYLYQIVFGVY